MSSIVTNTNRVGRFTSSMVHTLIKKGRSAEFSAPGIKYINEKRHERKLMRSLDTGAYSRASAWGLFLEQFVFSHFMGMRYVMCADKTALNSSIDNHAGSADLIIPGELVADIKCFQPRKFCLIADCFLLEDLEQFKKDFAAEYWQLVSNAMIHKVTRAESIVFMPTEENLVEIREMSHNYEGPDKWKYRFIVESDDYELAYIPNGSKYNSMYRFEFEVPQADIDLLTERLALAEDELINPT